MQPLKGATHPPGPMNYFMDLPALERIAMGFENNIIDQRQEVMDDAIDDVNGLDDATDKNQVLDGLA